jgi:signal transduction histidine kinase
LQLCQENEIYPSPDGLSVFIRDITERKRTEEAIRSNAEQLRQLSLHLQDIREEERASMAREVHDVLGQQLTAFKMDMSWLSRKIKNEDPDVKERMAGTLKLIDDTIKTVRKIASDLRPSILDDLGLVAALEWQSEEFEKRSGIKVYFNGTLQEQLVEPPMAIALFRIYQELLTNVARHANAAEVNSSLHLANGQLHLTVTDNGKGFDTENTGNKKTLGLLGIKERTLLMGGIYEIKSELGKGTAAVVSVPLHNSTTNN